MSWLSQPIHHSPNSITPFAVFCKLVTKSIEILSYFHSRILNSCMNPDGFWCSTFDLWQTKQEYTNSTTSFFIPDHQSIFLWPWYILVAPWCILKPLLWPSSRIPYCSSGKLGTQTMSRNLIIPFSSTMKSTPPWLVSANRSTNSKIFFCSSLISSNTWLVSFSISNFTLFDVTSHTKLISLNCYINCISLTISADICKDFLLEASATTLSFPGW